MMTEIALMKARAHLRRGEVWQAQAALKIALRHANINKDSRRKGKILAALNYSRRIAA